MSRRLETSHPALMVPHVVSLGVVIYTNGSLPPIDAEAIRSAIVSQLPPGSGVSSIQLNLHGIYEASR
jgi:hypothetical protein